MAVILLFALTKRLFPSHEPAYAQVPVLTATFHIISPAGVFLSAPYSESLFSCLSFLGLLLYAEGRANRQRSQGISRGLLTATGGLSLGLATLVRSNGVLCGLPYLFDVAVEAVDLFRSGPTIEKITHLTAPVLGGLFVALGAFWPQYEAFKYFCSANIPTAERREWCNSTFPSIYGWVQNHYWYVRIILTWVGKAVEPTLIGTLGRSDTGNCLTSHYSP